MPIHLIVTYLNGFRVDIVLFLNRPHEQQHILYISLYALNVHVLTNARRHVGLLAYIIIPINLPRKTQ